MCLITFIENRYNEFNRLPKIKVQRWSQFVSSKYFNFQATAVLIPHLILEGAPIKIE